MADLELPVHQCKVKVPWTVIFFLVGQTLGGIWWASDISAAVRQHTGDMARLERQQLEAKTERQNEDATIRREIREIVRDINDTLRRARAGGPP